MFCNKLLRVEQIKFRIPGYVINYIKGKKMEISTCYVNIFETVKVL